ncbi:MAG: rod shape-determining protein MreC [Sulfurovum sp.]|nr:rod shape-determining protein MreC [Sulfurovum sp.]
MKTRIFILILLLLILGMFLSRNYGGRIASTILNLINPIKQSYRELTQEIEEKGNSYLFQEKFIKKLREENYILRKQLLEQAHYIQQIQHTHQVLFGSKKLPENNIVFTNTISYTKLNNFSQIILTKPKDIQPNKLYGLIQKNVVAGIAYLNSGQLYGYLTSDAKCRFPIFIGNKKAPGIAFGLEKNKMIVKFIPKWYNIKRGDKVITSGLNNIFFAGLPVGIVTKVNIQNAYRVAYIKTYADLFHPDAFFLIKDAKISLAKLLGNKPIHSIESISQKDLSRVSSIPSHIDQTQTEVIELNSSKPKLQKNGSKNKFYDLLDFLKIF